MILDGVVDGVKTRPWPSIAHVHPQRDVTPGHPSAGGEESRVPDGGTVHQPVQDQDHQGRQVEGAACGEDHVAEFLVDVTFSWLNSFLPPAQRGSDTRINKAPMRQTSQCLAYTLTHMELFLP